MSNTIKTYALLAGLGGFAVAIGSLFGSGGALIGFALGLAMVGGSYWFSDKIALRAAGAQVVTEAEAPELVGIVRSLAERAGMPMPVVAMSPAMQPNAFATGRGPERAVVCATQGLVAMLPRDELEAVMAHELMHVRNRDILIGSVAAAIATGISYLAQMAMFSSLFGGGDDDDEGANPVALLAVTLLAPVAATILQMAISRSREYEADRGAAALLGSGDALARALERIEAAARQLPMPVQPAQASAWIHDPLAEAAPSQAAGRGRSMAKMFSTHPPTAERIARLRQMSFSR